MPSFSAGSAFISVVPSLKGFGSAVRTQLRGEDLAAPVRLEPEVDRRATEAEAEEAAKAASGRNVTFNAKLDRATLLADVGKLDSQLGKMRLDVDTSGAMARVTSFVGSVSRMSIGTLGMAAAVGAAGQLGAALLPLVGAVGVLPAAATAAAAGVGALKIGLSGVGAAIGSAFDPSKAKQFGEAMAKLSPNAREFVGTLRGMGSELTGLRLDVQNTLFAGLGSTVRQLATTYLPMARSGFASVAASINGMVQDAAQVLTYPSAIREMGNATSNVTLAWQNLRGAVGPATSAISTLVSVGSNQLPGIGNVITSLSQSFNGFILNAARTGQLNAFFDQAIQTIGVLGQVVGSVGSILLSVFSAASQQGTNFLSVLAQGAGALANFLRSGEGMQLLASIFGTIRAAMVAVQPLLLAIGNVLVTTVLPALLQVLPTIGSAVGSLAPAIAPVGQVIAALAPVLGQLAQIVAGALVTAVNTFAPVIVALVPVLSGLLSFLAPILNVFIQFAPVLLPIIGAILLMVQAVQVITTAIEIWTAVQAILDLELAPFILIALAIVAGIALIVGAVLFVISHLQFFRDLWSAIWGFVTSVASAAWGFIVQAAQVAWSILGPIFDVIGFAARLLATIVLTVLALPFVAAWKLISAIAVWAWNNVLSPIWNGAIAPALRFLGGVFMWLYENAVLPAWRGISTAIQVAWAFIRDSIFQPVVNFLRATLGPVFDWLYRNVIQPVWQGIQMEIRGAWSFIQGVFNVGMAAVHAVGQAFESVAQWIGRAWSAIKEAARGPVQFVVDVVYNNGIRPVWNGIAGLFGMPQLNPVQLAGGGVLPGYAPGRDTIPTILSAGEGVLVPEAVRGLGPAFVGWANSFFSGGRSSGGIGTPGNAGFAKGGIVRLADGGVLGGIGDFFSGAADVLMKLFTDPVGAIRDLFQSVVGDSSNTPGAGGWTGALKAIPGKVIDAVIQKAKDFISSLGSTGGGPPGAGVQRWTPVVLQALQMVGQPASLLPVVLRRMQQESGGNPTIFNNWDSNARKGTPSGGLMQVIQPTFDAYAGPLRGLGLLNPLANIYASMRYAMARYGSLAAAYNRAGGYDSGGWLPPGPSLTWNNTGRPEPVLTTNQWADVSAAAQNGGGGNQFHVYPSAPLDEVSLATMLKRRLDFEDRAVSA